MRGKILQATKSAPDLQIICIDDQLYLLRKDEIIDAVFSKGSVLTQDDLDRILSFSIKNSTSTPSVLNFEFSQNEIVLIERTPLEADSLFTNFPHHPQSKRGIPAVKGTAEGQVVIWNEQKAHELLGKILVASHLHVKYADVLKSIAGLILENGSILSHISILAREKKVPCIIGAKGATVVLKDKKVQMNGETGVIKAL